MEKEDIKKLEEEKQSLLMYVNQLDENKNKTITRLIEIQGILKYLTEDKEKK